MLVRLTRAPVVSIVLIRGRATGASPPEGGVVRCGEWTKPALSTLSPWMPLLFEIQFLDPGVKVFSFTFG